MKFPTQTSPDRTSSQSDAVTSLGETPLPLANGSVESAPVNAV